MNKLKSYIDLTSLTWWAGGVIPLVSGIMQVYGLEIPGVTEIARPLINEYWQGANPGALITAGVTVIGANAKLKRMSEAVGQDAELRPEFLEIDEDDVE